MYPQKERQERPEARAQREGRASCERQHEPSQVASEHSHLEGWGPPVGPVVGMWGVPCLMLPQITQTERTAQPEEHGRDKTDKTCGTGTALECSKDPNLALWHLVRSS